MLYEKIAPFVDHGTHLTDFRYTYLCGAIKYARMQQAINCDEEKALLDRITQALGGPRESVSLWLTRQGLIPGDWTRERHLRQIQLYRLRWLKHLCEEYENAVRKD